MAVSKPTSREEDSVQHHYIKNLQPKTEKASHIYDVSVQLACTRVVCSRGATVLQWDESSSNRLRGETLTLIAADS